MTETNKEINIARVIYDAYPHADLLSIHPDHDCRKLSAFWWDVTACFTVVGGFSFVAYTDTIQAFIMIIGCGIMLFIGLDKIGGWDALVTADPDAMRISKPCDEPNYPFFRDNWRSSLRWHFLLVCKSGQCQACRKSQSTVV